MMSDRSHHNLYSERTQHSFRISRPYSSIYSENAAVSMKWVEANGLSVLRSGRDPQFAGSAGHSLRPVCPKHCATIAAPLSVPIMPNVVTCARKSSVRLAFHSIRVSIPSKLGRPRAGRKSERRLRMKPHLPPTWDRYPPLTNLHAPENAISSQSVNGNYHGPACCCYAS
jgi:hypothetical protein